MSASRTRRALAVAAAGLGLTLLSAAALTGPAAATPSGRVTLCHATASTSNPYVTITVSTSSIAGPRHGVAHGHGTHTGPVYDADGGKAQPAWGDIIPAFGGAPGFAGQNLSDAGRAILDHGCQVPAPVPTPTATPTPTSTVTSPAPTPTVTSPAPTPTGSTPAATPTGTSPAPVVSPEPTGTPSPSSTTPAQQVLPGTGGGATLAHTGAPTGLIALLGAGLLAAGGVTLLAGRRRPALATGTDGSGI